MMPARVVSAARILAAALAVLSATGTAAAATLRQGFSETVVAGGLDRPTAMTFTPDGRILVCEQGGRLRVVRDGQLLAAPFLTVTVSSAGERGLLGVAVDPDFEVNQFVYVYYTATTPIVHNRVSRFTAAGDVAAAGSETILLELNPLTGATNHNGGGLHFGPDRLLYIGVGENANGANAQTLSNLLGKMLRINPDGSVPSTNPFLGVAAGVNQAIWAMGLRNPFSFAFEPLSGRLLINDVGQAAWEEINEGFPGANYGWPDTEGPTGDGRFVGPVYAYTHASGACAISGGTFYPVPPSQFPAEYAGDYFFADFCAGWIRQYDVAGGIQPGDFASGIVAPVDLRVGADGALYYLARGPGTGAGVVARIDFTGEGSLPTGRRAVPRTPGDDGSGVRRRRPLPCIDLPAPECGQPPPDPPEPPPGVRQAVPRAGDSLAGPVNGTADPGAATLILIDPCRTSRARVDARRADGDDTGDRDAPGARARGTRCDR